MSPPSVVASSETQAASQDEQAPLSSSHTSTITQPKASVSAPSRKAFKPLRSSIPSFVPTSQIVKLQSTMNRLKGLFTPTQSSTNLPDTKSNVTGKFTTAKEATSLFPPTSPEVDGEECLHDCESCTVALPRKWEIDESDELYGQVKGWDYHVVVATGKSDWVRDVIDEKGSLMEGLGVHGLEVQPTRTSSAGDTKRRRVMLSASNMPTGGSSDGEVDARGKTSYDDDGKTNVMVLPAWKFVEGVSKNEVSWFMNEIVASGPSNVDHLEEDHEEEAAFQAVYPNPDDHNLTTNPPVGNKDTPISTQREDLEPTTASSEQISNLNNNTTSTTDQSSPTPAAAAAAAMTTTHPATIPPGITVKTLHHQALILMCSHKTRDARCGQSAPLLRRELERHLRPLGLYRDLHDTRPNGVGIYFINHVGGHKYSANVMIYRRSGSSNTTNSTSSSVSSPPSPSLSLSTSEQAVQGIWLARVRPEDCENIVRYTVLQGKVVKPMRQLRGGFDRSCGLASW